MPASLLNLSTEQLRQLERLHVAAWPALRTKLIDGLLMRYSGGGSKRANSVSTIDYDGLDADASFALIEQEYAAVGRPAQVHTFAGTAITNLAGLLQARGYVASEATLTMVKQLDETPQRLNDALDPGTNGPDPAWLETYLLAITEDRREANTQVLKHVPKPRRFFQHRANGRTLSTVLCVCADGQAVLECVTTLAEARRQGAARQALAAAEAWAHAQGVRWMGLQVIETNAAAVNLYRSLGFVAVDTNRFWRKDNDGTYA